MKLLVCGGRDFKDTAFIFATLDKVHERKPVSIVIQGGADGADAIAKAWAKTRNIHHAQVDAIWRPNGVLDRGAGPKRNRAMLLLAPDAVVAFPGGAGTADMVKAARAAKVRIVWEPKP